MAAINLEELKQLGNASPEEEMKDLILVHVTKDEIKYLNEMQHGEELLDIDDGEGNLVGVPAYNGLYDKLKEPQVRKVFEEVASSMVSGREKSNEMEGISKFLKPFTPPEASQTGEVDTYSNILNILRNLGQGSDDQLALFPKGLANYFDMLRGGTEINKNTELRQYGIGKFFRKVIKIAAPIVGAIGGSIIGMPHLGAGLGGALSGAIGGGGLKGALMGGALGGLGSMALSGIGGGIADKFPGFASSIGLGGADAVSSGLKSSYLTPAVTNAAKDTAIKKGVENVAQKSFFSSLTEPGTMFPMALGAGLLMKGYKKDKTREQRQNEERRASNRAVLESQGLTATLNDVTPVKRYQNQYLAAQTPQELYGSPVRRHFVGNLNYYAKGGKVRVDLPLARIKEIQASSGSQAITGPGKGQEDRIPARLKKDDYIQDAHTVSMAGDGSTKAGNDEFKRFENLILRSAHKFKKGGINKEENHNPVDIPAALSDGERRTDYKVVRLLGGGSADKGAKIFDNLRKNLRTHKTSKGDKLPPKAYSLEHYLPASIRLRLVGE